MQSRRNKIADILSAAIFAALSAVLLLANNPADEARVQKLKAEVVEVDNSPVERLGLLTQGAQHLKVKMRQGRDKGKIYRAENILRAQLDLDKIFEVGDNALVAFPPDADAATTILHAQNFYRVDLAIMLTALFALLLALFAGWTGLKAMISFVFAAAFVWKVVVPACLSGANAIVVCFAAVAALTFAIIFLVGGFSRKATTAFAGAMAGVGASCLMAIIFTRLFHINGAVMPFSQALLYSGREFLSLSDLFIGGLFLSSSGAVMDLAMDVTAGQQEVFRHNPDISRTALAISGWKIGKSVVGTMTTTLLLAYSGGYLTLIMAFTAENVSPTDFLCNPYVSSELVKTIIGSFGLVLVAPFTAVIGGILIPKKSAK